MYIEDKYIQEQFKINFLSDKNNRNIVIYGTGIHTQRLLEVVNDNCIAGLMDAKRTGEVLWGKSVLSETEVAKLENPCIVILARQAVIYVIYRRIMSFVQQNRIPVYDINGNQFHGTKENLEIECFQLKQESIWWKIEQAEVISFDVFDTLITRKVMRPRDIFEIVFERLGNDNFDFVAERIRAEGDLDNIPSPTIEMIYRRMQENLHLQDVEIERLQALELQTEKDFLCRREVMCQILDKAVALGKQVYLVSDMYLSKEILENILSELGITGYQDLLVSCEHHCEKENGLFEILLDEKQIKPEKCLHIGDNRYADELSAQKAGMDTYRIYSPIEMLESSIYSDLLETCNSLEEKIILASFAAEAYNNPFGQYEGNGKLFLKTEKEIIRYTVAPVIFKYMLWLVQQLKRRENDLIIFPSRDGFLLKRLYDRICEKYSYLSLPPSVYLYTSRRLALVAAAQTREDIEKIISVPDEREKAESILSRFRILREDVGESGELTDALAKLLLNKAKVEKENYIDYLKQFNLDNYENPAFVDFVAIGTVQESLEELTNQNYCGLYFMRRMPDTKRREQLMCDALYGTATDFSANKNLYRFYYFLENLLTSYEPSVFSIDGDREPIFYEEIRTEEQLALIKRVHLFIEKYCEEMNKLCGDILGWTSSVKLYDGLLGLFSKEYTNIGELGLLHLSNRDEFMGKTVSENNR